MKKKRREEELRKEIARTSDVTKQLDLINELGALYRLNGDLEAAWKTYQRAVEVANSLRNYLDLSFAYRALSEIAAEKGHVKAVVWGYALFIKHESFQSHAAFVAEMVRRLLDGCSRGEALEHAENFRKTAERSGSYSQIQLALHVTGWVYEKLNVQQSHDLADLEEALSWCLKSLDYLRRNEHRIDADRKAVAVGGNSARRKAGLERLCSGLCANLQRRCDAEKYWNAAYAYAKRTQDTEVEYELLLARIDFSWESPVKNAQRLVNFAPVKKKGYALIELAQVLMYAGDFLGAQNALYDCLLHHKPSLMIEDAELLDARIIFLYKYFYRLDRSKSSDCDRRERRLMYELIADSFCSYGGERKEMFEHALKFYKMMFQESVTDKEKFSAAISIAQTYKDLEAFDDAIEWFEKALAWEKKMGAPDVKLCQTRVLIFEAKSRRINTSKRLVNEEFGTLNSEIPEQCFSLKAAMYEAMGRFLAACGEEVEASLFQARAKEFASEAEFEGIEEDEGSDAISDDLEARPDKAILLECIENARVRDSDREIVKDRDKEKNAHGETRLHIAARNSDTTMVERLIAAGYDVNKRDYGGWTPISEAVSAGMRDNVRALLRAGAKVDPVSKEALNDDENSTGGGITPLMEACDKGFLDIAKDLLKCGASVVKKNADGWTAVDFLRNFIITCGIEDDDLLKELNSFAVAMEDQQRSLCFPVRGCAPLRRISKRNGKSTSKTCLPKTPNRDEAVDLSGYKRVISRLGAQSKKIENSRPRDESTLFFDDDLDPQLTDDVLLPSDCEDQESNSQLSAEIGTTTSPSPPPLYLGLCAPTTFRGNNTSPTSNAKDDSLLDDLDQLRRKRSRKRGSSVASNERIKRHSQQTESSSFVVPVRSPEHGRSSSPEVIIRRPGTSAFKSTDGSTQAQVNQIDYMSATSSISQSVDGTPIIVTLKFEDEDGGKLRPDKLVSFARSATMKTAEERVRSELASYEVASFDVRLSDAREADPDIPLLYLGEPLVLVCRVRKSITVKECSVRADAYYHDDHNKHTTKDDSASVLDLSLCLAEDSAFFEGALKPIANGTRCVSSLIVDGCEPTSNILSLLAKILPKIERFSFKCSGLVDGQLAVLNLPSSSLSLCYVDLSHNEIRCGETLSNFLLSCSQLIELRLCDLEIVSHEEVLILSICGLQQLRTLDVSFNSFIRGSFAETLLASCEKLSSLRLDGCDLSDVTFESIWLPNLEELSMVGCQVTNFDSLIEWMSLGCVKQLDLSSTEIELDHVRMLVESRLICPTITVHLVRCRGVERDPRAFTDMILAFVNDGSFPLRFRFSSEFASAVQAITAFASNFLT